MREGIKDLERRTSLAKEGESYTLGENGDINTAVWQRLRGRRRAEGRLVGRKYKRNGSFAQTQELEAHCTRIGSSERSPTVTEKLTVWRAKEAKTKEHRLDCFNSPIPGAEALS